MIATPEEMIVLKWSTKETLHKARLTALHAICLQIFRHIAQKSLAIHQVCLRNFYAICRKIWLRISRTSFIQCFLNTSLHIIIPHESIYSFKNIMVFGWFYSQGGVTWKYAIILAAWNRFFQLITRRSSVQIWLPQPKWKERSSKWNSWRCKFSCWFAWMFFLKSISRKTVYHKKWCKASE